MTACKLTLSNDSEAKSTSLAFEVSSHHTHLIVQRWLSLKTVRKEAIEPEDTVSLKALSDEDLT